jgi:hypothetical protein
MESLRWAMTDIKKDQSHSVENDLTDPLGQYYHVGIKTNVCMRERIVLCRMAMRGG